MITIQEQHFYARRLFANLCWESKGECGEKDQTHANNK